MDLRTIIKNKLIKLIPNSIKFELNKPYKINCKLSYSQEGEDLILNRLFLNKKKGFYIDVGAHHPIKFSNTFLLYKNGWNGINIDAMPNSMEIFKTVRNRDINIEAAISNEKEQLKYFIFNEKALNTFSSELAVKRHDNTNFKIIETVKLNTIPLSEILEKYLETTQEIDFLSIDAEGFDLKVLKSNDWNRFRPKVILIEESNSDIINIINNSEVYKYLIDKSYVLFAKTFNTLFFKMKNSNI
jgi:FkbM family methyltransferase